MNKKYKTGFMIVLTILFFLTAFLTGFIAASLKELPLVILYFCVYLISLNVFYIMHELGHAFFGKVTGYRTLVIGIGSFQWFKKGGEWHFIKKPSIFSGAAQYAGIAKDRQNHSLWMLRGGLITHICFCILFFGLAYVRQSLLYVPFAMMHVFLFLMNSFPMGITDGARIQELKKHPERFDLFYENNRLYEAELNSEKLTNFELVLPELEKGILVEAAYIQYYTQAFYKKEFDEVKTALEYYSSFTENDILRAMSNAILLETYIITGDIEKATNLYKDKTLMKYLAQKPLLHAMYVLYIQKDFKKGKKYVQQAKKLLSPNMEFSDVFEHDKQNLENLEQLLTLDVSWK
ncbi:hypothetical protein KG091_05875 [Carnobacteriaceae bacterium zg-ZUI78]|nr:hypothetical protein [Carnobacteriaceae bacterium zg-ZUI78]